MYGCYNRTFKKITVVQNGYKTVVHTVLDSEGTARHERGLVQNFEDRPFTMSTDCHYDVRMTDERCEGCKHQQKNYCVNISSRKYYYCSTPKEVWEIIGKRGIGDTYLVSSPNGSDCSMFVAF
jgi:hypothetical protein